MTFPAHPALNGGLCDQLSNLVQRGLIPDPKIQYNSDSFTSDQQQNSEQERGSQEQGNGAIEENIPTVQNPDAFERPGPGDPVFKALDSEGHIMLYKDKRNPSRGINPSYQPSNSNDGHEVLISLPSGGSYKGPVDIDIRREIATQALKTQKAQYNAMKANTLFIIVSSLALILGMAFGIKTEMKKTP